MSGLVIGIRLAVNGRSQEVRCRPGDTLLDVIRGPLGLIGTKPGCEIGYCGACTVLLDGAAVHSCCVLAATVGERQVTTIEGLIGHSKRTRAIDSHTYRSQEITNKCQESTNKYQEITERPQKVTDRPREITERPYEVTDKHQEITNSHHEVTDVTDEYREPIPAAFLEEGAVQCGYCTPGFVMSVHALLNENPAPSESDIRRFLSGNICRCSGFAAIVRAVRRAAESITIVSKVTETPKSSR